MQITEAARLARIAYETSINPHMTDSARRTAVALASHAYMATLSPAAPDKLAAEIGRESLAGAGTYTRHHH